ncbi:MULTISPECIES: DUF4192 family protein [unclassified Leucobacter]|uniref:DUF4192 family protein n=1 Tax=unclassified Leucobacter TaxID=2621730 RepID=UPI00165E0DE2|nr:MULTISPECIES: DUF4192 family protein [unclassified Leucobacter]MBC9926152.1 DUF4192 family protein [Leucobacter sp. cx-169]
MTPPHTPTPSRPAVIKAESSADFLALLPAFTGYSITNSLLVVLFQGNQSFGSLRFDLPEDTGPDQCVSLSHAVAQVVGGIAQVDGVAFAMLTDARSTPGRGAPWQDLARLLQRGAARAGLVLRDSCCIAADGWASYLSPEPGGAMRPLSEIEHSMAGLEASVIIDEPVPDIEQLGSLPERNAARAADVRHRIDELTARPARTKRGVVFAAPRLAALVARPGAIPTANDIARLACTASGQSGWLRLVCAAVAAALPPYFPSGEMGAEDVGPVSEMTYIADCLDRGGAFDDPQELTRAFGPLEHALILFAAVPPDRDLCRRAIALVSEATAHAPRDLRPGLHCLAAWLWWWTGLTSVAAKHIDDALRLEPGHQLGEMLRHLIDSGQFPLWTLDFPIGARPAP